MEHRITLNGTWNWCDMESKEWHKGIVPGTVLTDMMDGGRMSMRPGSFPAGITNMKENLKCRKAFSGKKNSALCSRDLIRSQTFI
ncbi:hypothetical protein [Hungatella sp.]|uniref:hypothetical protein n=1 Tax=Hungatella sp. TaxID=2613924 RepID=UPI003991CFFC